MPINPDLRLARSTEIQKTKSTISAMQEYARGGVKGITGRYGLNMGIYHGGAYQLGRIATEPCRSLFGQTSGCNKVT